MEVMVSCAASPPFPLQTIVFSFPLDVKDPSLLIQKAGPPVTVEDILSQRLRDLSFLDEGKRDPDSFPPLPSPGTGRGDSSSTTHPPRG